MKSEEKQLFSAATLISLALHALVLYGVMNLPIGLDERQSLFARPRMVEVPVTLARAAEDAYLEPGQPSILEQITSQAAESQAVRNDAAEVLKSLNPAELAPPEQLDASDVAADDPAPRLLAPKPAGDVEAEPAKVVDLSHKLLAMAQPSINLPEYKAPTDEISAPTPDTAPVNALAGIDMAQLKQIDAILAPGNSGAGGAAAMRGPLVGAEPDLSLGNPGTGSGTGTGAAAPGTGAGASGKPMPERMTPAPPPPALPAKLPEPPPVAIALPQGNEKAVHLDEDFDYQLHVYKEPPPRPGFFGIGTPAAPEVPWFEVRITPRRSLHRLKPLNKDVVWVLDTSESISSDWVASQKMGVNVSLTSLDPGDRFNIVLFKDNVQVLGKNGPLPATPENFELARRFLAGAESSGYTDVNRALGQLITRGVGDDRVYNIVLVSDGVPTRGAVDARAIINMITRENNLTAAIYCVGIGDTIDRKLLEFLAYRNKGYVLYPGTPQKAATSIRELAGRTRYPVLKDATFDAVGVDTSTIYPRIPRDVYQGETFSLFGRSPAEAADKKISMRITGSSGPQVLDFTFTLPFAQAKAGDEQIAQNWAFWKLHHLYSEIIRQGETKQLKDEIDELRRKYKLKTAY